MGRAKSHIGGGSGPMYLEYNTKQQTRTEAGTMWLFFSPVGTRQISDALLAL
jgi:hypothetical protein